MKFTVKKYLVYDKLYDKVYNDILGGYNYYVILSMSIKNTYLKPRPVIIFNDSLIPTLENFPTRTKQKL